MCFPFHSLLSQVWGSEWERESAPSASHQDPGILNKQSGQGIARSARMPAWYFHRAELEVFWVVMSLGQGVGRTQWEMGIYIDNNKLHIPFHLSFSEKKCGVIFIFNANWGLSVPIRANGFFTLSDNVFKTKSLKSLAEAALIMLDLRHQSSIGLYEWLGKQNIIEFLKVVVLDYELQTPTLSNSSLTTRE